MACLVTPGHDHGMIIPSHRGVKLLTDGPTGADVLLANRKHDGYLAMYHDQGHVPVKLISPRQASAVTIGAGILFSSVGHGSAHDIAGRGIADATSVRETLALLASVSGRQA